MYKWLIKEVPGENTCGAGNARKGKNVEQGSDGTVV